jgi:hypothetical protein
VSDRLGANLRAARQPREKWLLAAQVRIFPEEVAAEERADSPAVRVTTQRPQAVVLQQ